MPHKYYTLTNQEIKTLRYASYKRGALVGSITMLIIAGIAFAIYAVTLQNRLTDEVKATDYYYSLTQNND